MKTRTGPSFDVIVAGELNVDLIFNGIAGFPEIGKEILSDHMLLTLGSSSAIFAGNLCTLGSRVAFAGMLGRDRFGKVVAEALTSRGVDTSCLIYTDDAGTGATVVLNYGEDRAMVTCPGAMELLTAAAVGDEMLRNAKHLHVSSVFLQPRLREDLTGLFGRAKNLGLTTSLDTQWDPAGRWDLPLRQILPLTDVFLPNRQEFLALTGAATIDEGLDKISYYANAVVVKDGSSGAWLWDGRRLYHQEAFLNSEVVDCIGAGDSFDAGFIHYFVMKRKLRECIEFAALAGAVNTTSAGGTSAFSSPEAFRKTARERFGYKF